LPKERDWSRTGDGQDQPQTPAPRRRGHVVGSSVTTSPHRGRAFSTETTASPVIQTWTDERKRQDVDSIPPRRRRPTGGGEKMQHYPLVRRSTPEWWIVICPECQRDKQQTPPVGINVPVSTRAIAEMLATGHARRRGGLERELAGLRGSGLAPVTELRDQPQTPASPTRRQGHIAASGRSLSTETTASPSDTDVDRSALPVGVAVA